MSRTKPGTRTRILIAAQALLEESSGKGVRMSDIAAKAAVSRQAVYLHFATRAELLIAVTHYVDEMNDSDGRLAASRAATSGTERLEAFVRAWADYMPIIYPIAKALIIMGDTDEEAASAWAKRMADMREGCEAAIKALKRDGTLSAEYSAKDATDLLWAMLQVRNWEQLTQTCGWSQKKFADHMAKTAHRLFVAG